MNIPIPAVPENTSLLCKCEIHTGPYIGVQQLECTEHKVQSFQQRQETVFGKHFGKLQNDCVIRRNSCAKLFRCQLLFLSEGSEGRRARRRDRGRLWGHRVTSRAMHHLHCTSAEMMERTRRAGAEWAHGKALGDNGPTCHPFLGQGTHLCHT